MDLLVEKYITLTNHLRPYIMHHSRLPFEKKWATILQFIALKYLSANPEATMGDLAARIKISISSATQLMNRFIKDGLVKKSIDSKDKRVIRLVLTEKGKKRLMKQMEEKKKRMKIILAHLSTQDLSELVRINKALLQSLQNDESLAVNL